MKKDKDKICVMIVDDHRVLAESLSTLLGSEPGIRVCGNAANLAEADALLSAKNPDVILLDLNLGENESGFTLLEKVKATRPEIRVVVVSTYDGETFRGHAALLGADDYVPKGSAASEIVAAIRHAVSSDPVRPGGESFAKTALQRHRCELFAALSPSEKRTLNLLVSGLSQKEIGARMGISASTVGTYVQRARDKFNARSLAHLISIVEVLASKEDCR